MRGQLELNGEYIGILSIEKDIKPLSKVLVSEQYTTPEDIYLIDDQGYPLTPNSFDPHGILKRKLQTPNVLACMEDMGLQVMKKI